MSFLLRNGPNVTKRPFTSSSLKSNTISLQHTAATHLSSHTSSLPKLGRIARWYLPTMTALALGIIYLPKSLINPPPITRRTVTLPAATANIGFGVTSALNEANRKAGMQKSQEQRNMALMDAYGERNSLEDMERAIAGLDAPDKLDRNGRLEEAYGARESVRDLERAMRIYEVQ